MPLSRVCAVVLSSVVAWPCLVMAGPEAPQERQQACATEVPSNIRSGIVTSEVVALLRASDTFRAQCQRIAADPRVQVHLEIVTGVDAGGRAQTALRRFPSGTLVADVELLFGENYRELLAHEFEHIIEQIEGVNLSREAADGRAWRLPGGAFETRRAFLVGVQVLREAESMHTHAVVVAHAAR